MTEDFTLDDLPTPEFEGAIDTEELHVDGENPNEMTDEQFGLLCDRLRERGWLGGPIVTNTDGLIADGEHRWRAAQEIGLSEVPVRQHDFDDATRRMVRQELNKIHGEHDTKRDALEYDTLLSEGFTEEVEALTDAAEEDLDELLAEIRIDGSRPAQYEYDPEHNVYFEDCVEGMRERLEDDSVDCVITDPPYGVDWQSTHREEPFDAIDADGNIDEALELYRSTLAEIERILKPDGHLYVFTHWKTYAQFKAATEGIFTHRNTLVWAKNNWGMGQLNYGYRPQHEWIIYAHKEGPRPLTESSPDLLEYARPPSNEYTHPTEKPVSLVARLLELSTDYGDRVLDPFMGSGTTAVAAIQNDRDYVGFEIDAENYKDVIERRIGEAKRATEAEVNADA